MSRILFRAINGKASNFILDSKDTLVNNSFSCSEDDVRAFLVYCA